MACRMLVGAGRLPLARLLDGFSLMAQNMNEEHEYSDRPDHVHGDGWGVVYGKSGALTCYRREVACWEDPAFTDLYEVEPDFIMLHARRASPGIAVRHEFTHPFEQDGRHFCHNGMVHDFEIRERSDSQQLFALILEKADQLHDLSDAIAATARSLKEYSALNFILLGNGRVYILNMCGKRGEKTPRYYTMKYLQADDYTVVSSEALPDLDAGWQEMKNGTLLTLTLPNRALEIRDI